VNRSKARLNAAKNRPSGPLAALRGRSSIAARAGERLSALNAEMSTDTAIVTANCRLRRPWMPPMNATGRKTEERISAIATTGPETSRIA
jgi:hypothetical protein